MAHCRVLLCNINKKSDSQDSGFLSISNKDLVTFYFPLAIFQFFLFFCFSSVFCPDIIGQSHHAYSVNKHIASLLI